MQSFLWKIYLSRFLDSFILIGGIFTLFFSQHGLTPFQISTLISIWSLTTILLEVPMGVLADTYSRRNLLSLGLLFRAEGFLFWMQGGFMNYAIGLVLWGVKNTLTSGTLEAFVYDELVSYRQESQYEKISGKMNAFFSLGLLLSAVLGGMVAQMSFYLVLVCSIFTTLAAAMMFLTIRNVKSVRSTGETKYWDTLKQAIWDIHNNKRLLFLMLFICVVFAAYGATDEFWPLMFESWQLSTSVIGFLVAGVYGMNLLAGSTVAFLNKSGKVVLPLIVIAGGLYLGVGIGQSMWLLPFAFLAMYFFQIASIKIEAQMQHMIKAHQRATISSLKSFLFELIYVSFILLFGIVGTQLSVTGILLITALIVIVTASVYGVTSQRPLPE